MLATDETALEPRQLAAPDQMPLLPPGSTLEAEHKRLIAAFGGEYRAPKMQAYLGEIAERLRLVSDRPSERYRVTVLNSGEINAFALPNGYIYVTRGLLALTNNSAEIAAVLAHEAAHVSARHAVSRAEYQSEAQLLHKVAQDVLGKPGARSGARETTFAGFSRAQELEADEIGIRALAKAGFSPQGAAQFLVTLARAGRGLADGEAQAHLTSHPATLERAERAQRIAREYAAPGVGEAERGRWLAALDGLALGEDPAQGFVRANRFTHPKTRVTFAAPEGFTLNNTPTAVLGVSPSGSEALRFDSTRVDPERSLSAWLAQSPIEGATIGPVEPLAIGEFAAVSALAKGREWSFRIVLVRVGDYVHRFLYAARQLTPQTDESFLAATRSLRKLSEAEIKAALSQKLRLAKAQEEDPTTFVARAMPHIPEAETRFQSLNGLDAREKLVVGALYKIVGP